MAAIKNSALLNHDEKRDHVRMYVDCEISHRQADDNLVKKGKCKTLSATGLSFISNQAYALGRAVEISIPANTAISPPLTAFVEILRVVELPDGNYEIATSIRSIKGN